MATVKTILVRTQPENGQLAPLGPGHQFLDIDADPDGALELVRVRFKERWSAAVHALRWIFPEYLMLPDVDGLPYLVLHVDGPGTLNISDNESGCNLRLASRQLRVAAARPSSLEPWCQPSWLNRFFEWAVLSFQPEKVKGMSQVRICTNGAVVRIDTEKDCYYAKAVPGFLAHEPKLLGFLAQNFPGICPPVLPISPDPATHITRGIRGSPLRMTNNPAAWAAVIKDVAEFQVRTINHVEALKDLGVPYQSLQDFTEKLESILERLLARQKGAPGELTPGELDNFSLLLSKAKQDFYQLGECGIPEALIHGDLTEHNAFCTSTGTTSLIDWTFSRLGHPFFVLGFTVFAARDPKHLMHHHFETLNKCYAQVWQDYAPVRALHRGLDAASRLFWIDTAQVVDRLIQEISGELPGTVAHLSMVLRRLLAAFGLSEPECGRK
jgi:hypothetical protein